MELVLFTTSTCPMCPKAVELANNSGLEVLIIEADTTPGAMQLAAEWEVHRVPRFFGIKDREVVLDIEGLPDQEKLDEVIKGNI